MGDREPDPREMNMKTLDQIHADGYERVCCNRQRKHLWASPSNSHEIKLTNGENGFGMQIGHVCVILIRKQPERTVVEHRDIKRIEETVSGLRNRMGDNHAIADFALTTEINAARDELIALVPQESK